VVSQCKEVPDGQGVSYGLRYHTSGPSTLGLIPVGYADGIPRVATGGPVRVAGRTYPVVGRIAMDQMVIDLGDVGPAGAGLLGAEAQLFGDGADGGPTADDWARAAGTINYEIVTRISPRVPRRFINEQAIDGHGREGAA
jgi:alanine racemase